MLYCHPFFTAWARVCFRLSSLSKRNKVFHDQGDVLDQGLSHSRLVAEGPVSFLRESHVDVPEQCLCEYIPGRLILHKRQGSEETP